MNHRLETNCACLIDWSCCDNYYLFIIFDFLGNLRLQVSIDPERVPYWKVKFVCLGFGFDFSLFACFFLFLLIFSSKHE